MTALPIVLEVPREVSTGNALAYRHWRMRMKDRQSWWLYLRAQLARLPVWPAKATTRRRVEIVSYRRRLIEDDDNLSGGCKHLRDCIARLGLIVDDNKRWAAFTYDQALYRRAGKPAPCTRITISEISG